MQYTTLTVCGRQLPVLLCRTAVLGGGAAGWAAAWRLARQTETVLLCDDPQAGTSRNAGSDKQTYYRLGAVGAPDSVEAMAQDLFDGGAADGDLALCEVALSARCFYALSELGVPFPSDRYGRAVGYKTDHDPAGRASSVGPYTSRAMTQQLEAAARAAHVQVQEGWQAIRLLTPQQTGGAAPWTDDGEAPSIGVLCLNRAGEYCACLCRSLVLATGGPADIWQHSVYPAGQTGAAGLALEAGTAGKNLTEWQFGLASLAPRWNVSGTYMQALPRFFSVDEAGNTYDFLQEAVADGWFADKNALLSAVFFKGYQWPFDARRTGPGGSSRIDLAVLREQQRGRRVYLDFTRELCGPVDWQALQPEAAAYLRAAGACLPGPFARLAHMNAPAAAFYAEHGVDLSAQPLEIGVCAQHHNGGIGVDLWYRTGVSGLFCIGEAAATHGVRRPGGSALNAGQVGALRAAQYILARRAVLEAPTPQQAAALLAPALGQCLQLDEAVRRNAAAAGAQHPAGALAAARARMSRAAGILRQPEALSRALQQTREALAGLPQLTVAHDDERKTLYRLRQVLVCQCAVLAAMADYVQRGLPSRGSALVAAPDAAADGLRLLGCAYRPEPPAPDGAPRPDERQVQELWWNGGDCRAVWRPVRPIPQDDLFFENVWRAYRETGGVY